MLENAFSCQQEEVSSAGNDGWGKGRKKGMGGGGGGIERKRNKGKEFPVL